MMYMPTCVAHVLTGMHGRVLKIRGQVTHLSHIRCIKSDPALRCGRVAALHLAPGLCVGSLQCKPHFMSVSHQMKEQFVAGNKECVATSNSP